MDNAQCYSKTILDSLPFLMDLLPLEFASNLELSLSSKTNKQTKNQAWHSVGSGSTGPGVFLPTKKMTNSRVWGCPERSRALAMPGTELSIVSLHSQQSPSQCYFPPIYPSGSVHLLTWRRGCFRVLTVVVTGSADMQMGKWHERDIALFYLSTPQLVILLCQETKGF